MQFFIVAVVLAWGGQVLAQAPEDCRGADRIILESVCQEAEHIRTVISYQGQRQLNRLSYGVQLPQRQYSGSFKFQGVEQVKDPGTYTLKAFILPSQREQDFGRIQNMHYIFEGGTKQGCGLFNNKFPQGSGRLNRYPAVVPCND